MDGRLSFSADRQQLGLLLGYTVMGTIVFAVMVALGEMASILPIEGGFITFAARFVNSPFGFVVGWWYAYDWLLALGAELSASAVLIGCVASCCVARAFADLLNLLRSGALPSTPHQMSTLRIISARWHSIFRCRPDQLLGQDDEPGSVGHRHRRRFSRHQLLRRACLVRRV